MKWHFCLKQGSKVEVLLPSYPSYAKAEIRLKKFMVEAANNGFKIVALENGHLRFDKGKERFQVWLQAEPLISKPIAVEVHE